LSLLLAGVVGGMVCSFSMIILIGFLLVPLLWITMMVFAIMGLISAIKGTMKPLPLIGKIQIIK